MIAPTVPFATATIMPPDHPESSAPTATLHLPEQATEQECPKSQTETNEVEIRFPQEPSPAPKSTEAKKAVGNEAHPEAKQKAAEAKPAKQAVTNTTYPHVLHGGKTGKPVLSPRGIMFKEDSQGSPGKKVKLARISRCQTTTNIAKPLLKIVATTNASKVFQIQDKETLVRLCDDIHKRKQQHSS